MPDDLNITYFSKTDLTSDEMQAEINQIEECLNLPKTVCLII